MLGTLKFNRYPGPLTGTKAFLKIGVAKIIFEKIQNFKKAIFEVQKVIMLGQMTEVFYWRMIH